MNDKRVYYGAIRRNSDGEWLDPSTISSDRELAGIKCKDNIREIPGFGEANPLIRIVTLHIEEVVV